MLLNNDSWVHPIVHTPRATTSVSLAYKQFLGKANQAGIRKHQVMSSEKAGISVVKTSVA